MPLIEFEKSTVYIIRTALYMDFDCYITHTTVRVSFINKTSQPELWKIEIANDSGINLKLITCAYLTLELKQGVVLYSNQSPYTSLF
jgi:hypothetical protein